MKDIKFKLAKPGMPRIRVIKKKCDHALTINKLETQLKSKENEFQSLKSEFNTNLKQR